MADQSGRNPEFERRWIVLDGMDRGVFATPSQLLEQGYLEGKRNPRVRIIDGKTAVLTRKTGRGRSRTEHNHATDVATARYLLEGTYERIEKLRHVRDGWEIDRFQGPLTGLTLIEIEKPSAEELDAVVPPAWAGTVVEITDTLSNRDLARIAAELDGEPFDVDKYLRRPSVPSIVITGGPAAGKTTLIAEIKRRYSGLLHCVPEAATIVIEQVGAKPPTGDRTANRAYQRLMYEIQLRFEQAASRQARQDGRVAMCLDRGTVDGAAYMAGGVPEAESVFRNAIEDEYARYAAVICLAVPSPDVYERVKGNNAARYETAEQALATGERIRRAWSSHPAFTYVDNGTSFDDKLSVALAAFEAAFKSPK